MGFGDLILTCPLVRGCAQPWLSRKWLQAFDLSLLLCLVGFFRRSRTLGCVSRRILSLAFLSRPGLGFSLLEK